MRKARRIAVAIGVVALTSLLVVEGKSWIWEWWGIRTSDTHYFWGSYLLLMMVAGLATRRLFAELRSERLSELECRISVSSDTSNGNLQKARAIYKYPVRVAVFSASLGLFFFLVPFFANSPDYPIVGYFLDWVISSWWFGWAAYDFRFSICIEREVVKVRGFSEQSFRLDDVVSVQVTPTRGATVAIVKLKNGKKFSCTDRLKDFEIAVQELRSGLGESVVNR